MVHYRSSSVGPPPDPDALIRKKPQDAASWTRLPGSGLAEAPEWPLEAMDPERLPSMQEQALWNRMWTTYPQAHLWKRGRLELQVATYCRVAVFCSSRLANAPALTSFRQLADVLLINPLALRAGRFIIDEEIQEVVEERTSIYGVAPVIQIRPVSDVRDRLAGGSLAVETPDPEEDDDEDLGPEDEDA
jgi:hypothetical protein